MFLGKNITRINRIGLKKSSQERAGILFVCIFQIHTIRIFQILQLVIFKPLQNYTITTRNFIKKYECVS